MIRRLTLAIICVTLLWADARSNTELEQVAPFVLDSAYQEPLDAARIYCEVGHVDSALQILAELNDAFQQEDSLRCILFDELFQCNLALGNYDLCQKYFDSLESTRDKLPSSNDILTAFLLTEYIDFLLLKNDFDSAKVYIARASSLFDTLNIASGKQFLRYVQLRGRYHVQISEFQVADSIFDEVTGPLIDIYGKESVEYAEQLQFNSLVKSETDRHEEAILLLQSAYDILSENGFRIHQLTAMVLTTLARNHKELGHQSKAESLYVAALDIYEHSFDDKLPSLIVTLNNLSVLYWTYGEYSKVEPILKRSIRLQIAHNESGTVLGALYVNLANLYYKLGRYEDALEYFYRSLKVWDALLEPDHLLFSKTYNNLGVTYKKMEQYDKSLEYLLQALEIREKALGASDPQVANTLHNLSQVYMKMGKYEEVEHSLVRSLQISENSYGRINRFVAKNVLDLAKYYISTNTNPQKAESLFIESMNIRKELYPAYHPEIAESYDFLAHFYLSTGNYEKSYDYFKLLLDARQTVAQYVFSFSSEDQKLSWIERNPLIINSLLSLSLIDSSNSKLDELALEMVLKGKAIVLSSMARERSARSCSSDSVIVRAQKYYTKLGTAIADLALSKNIHNLQDSLQSLLRGKDSTESFLNRNCSNYVQSRKVGEFRLNSISSALRDSETLLEYITYRPFTLSCFHTDTVQQEARCLVFTLNNKQEIQIRDLGLSQIVDSLIGSVRSQIDQNNNAIFSSSGRFFEKELRTLTSSLYERIIDPIGECIAGQDRLYIAADGMLSIFPFEILCKDSTSSYFIDEHSCFYLNSGRELIEHQSLEMSTPLVVVFADPDPLGESHNKTLSKNDNSEMTEKSDARSNNRDCLSNRRFPRLPFARKEGEMVAELSRGNGYDVEISLGKEASEARLKSSSRSPFILHIASHGYYCETNSNAASKYFLTSNSGLILSRDDLDQGVNPMGISIESDGILSALEVSELNLQNTHLVNLAACKTGIGEVVTGEGVFGLRRAFHSAGAQSIMMSLWDIPDDLSYKIMSRFYKDWYSGNSKHDALRAAVLSAKSESESYYDNTHPLLWAGFMLVGIPR